MSYTGPKVRLSRRFGVALTPKAARILEKRPYPPGEHGRDHRTDKDSVYKQQLMQKQLLRSQYNIREKQMRRYYAMAQKSRGNTALALVQMLETRLDAIIMRAGLAPTIYAARQIVSHGHIEVAGRKVDIPSYGVKPGEVVSIREKSQNLLIFQNLQYAQASLPYLEILPRQRSVRLLRLPELGEAPVLGELNRVIEFYSR
ncbi:MAG TPA: 30S ribosomal protein S4 [Bellilinea sp.]|nr:30S ribosomal protein S4 [Bellilinea sp.]